jgi:hypothetical protein
MNKLQDCYEMIHHLIGEHIEPYDSVKLVDEYRQYWKPDKTKVILLAESHVRTTHVDMKIKIPQIQYLEKYPNKYVKFVYCLAYGEKELTKNEKHPKRDGTPQFWKVFYSCLHCVSKHDNFISLQKSTPFEERLKNKINVLRTMKSKGIWLIDTSIIALYDKGEKLPNIEIIEQLSWETYTKELVVKSNPNYVICVGKGVGNIVSKDLNNIIGENFDVLPQPNAYLSSSEQITIFQRYYEICSKYT